MSFGNVLRVNALPKTELPATPTEAPTRTGMVGEAGAVLRVSDRIRAREATAPVVAQQSKSPAQQERERLMKVYGDIYEREQAEEKAQRAKSNAQRAHEARVREAHRDAAARDAAWKSERDTAVVNQMIQDSARREIKYLLADEPAEIINEVIRRVTAAKMLAFVPAWRAFLDEVKSERRG